MKHYVVTLAGAVYYGVPFGFELNTTRQVQPRFWTLITNPNL